MPPQQARGRRPRSSEASNIKITLHLTTDGVLQAAGEKPKSVSLKRGNPPVHPSWRAFDKTDKIFRIELRDKDYARYQLIMNRRS